MARRSVLFTPGDRPEMIQTALGAGADVVVCDLEDAVSPSRKADARRCVREALADRPAGVDCEVCVRVNPVGTALDADLEGLFGGDPTPSADALVLPKVGSVDDVATLRERTAASGVDRPVLALIESARGVLAAPEIAAAPGTDTLLFGAEDLATDLGAVRTPEGREVEYARQRTVLAASAHGVDAVDTLTTDVEDEGRLREEAATARQLGFDGKLAIHPAQVGPIHEAFAPGDEEVEWARSVLDALAERDEDDRGVFAVDGEMIDQPLIERARGILARREESDGAE